MVGVEDAAQGGVGRGDLVVQVAHVGRGAPVDDLAAVQPSDEEAQPLSVQLAEQVGLVGEVLVQVVDLRPGRKRVARLAGASRTARM